MSNNLTIPSSILGIPNIAIEHTEFNNKGEYIITVKCTQEVVKCNMCQK